MLTFELQETSGPLPTSLFILKKGAQPIGMLQLRHRPSKSAGMPQGFESHMYYEIDPAYRGQGYGIQILERGLEQARALPLREIILTCAENNIPSRKIIERNGGVLLETRATEDGVMMRKYKITL